MGLKELPAPFDAEERFGGRYRRPPSKFIIYLPGLAVLALGVALHYLGLLAFGKTIEVSLLSYLWAILTGAWACYMAISVVVSRTTAAQQRFERQPQETK